MGDDAVERPRPTKPSAAYTDVTRTADCPVCRRTFASRAYRNAHMRIHTHETCYTCRHPSCTYRCRTTSALRQHEKRHHRGEGDGDGDGARAAPVRRPCTVCAKMLLPLSMASHMKTQHNMALDGSPLPPTEPVECPECGRMLKSEQTLAKHMENKHMRRTVYVCRLCPARRKTYAAAVNHMRRCAKRFCVADSNLVPLEVPSDSNAFLVKAVPPPAGADISVTAKRAAAEMLTEASNTATATPSPPRSTKRARTQMSAAALVPDEQALEAAHANGAFPCPHHDGHIYQTEAALRTHIHRHRRCDGMFVCPCCPMPDNLLRVEFVSQRELMLHMRLYHSDVVRSYVKDGVVTCSPQDMVPVHMQQQVSACSV